MELEQQLDVVVMINDLHSPMSEFIKGRVHDKVFRQKCLPKVLSKLMNNPK